MMNIILAGHIALEATNKLITTQEPALSCRFSDRFLKNAQEISSTYRYSYDSIENILAQSELYREADCESDDKNDESLAGDFLMELSELGIFGGLWEYAEKRNTGVKVFLDKISIRQETVEIFEQLNINPYTYPSGGAWLIGAEKAYELADYLNENGVFACVIGYETDSNDRVIINQDEIRYLTPADRLLKDEQGINNFR